MFNIIEQDIFKAVSEKKIQHFAHGANCWTTMGAGIADKVRTKMPELYKADCEFHLSPEKRLGRYSDVILKNGVHGYNMYTQFYPGRHARLDMIRSSLTLVLESIAETLLPEEVVNLGLPAIGCGIGGLTFFQVAQVIHEVTYTLKQDYPGRSVDVYMFAFPDAFLAERKAAAYNGYTFELEPGAL